MTIYITIDVELLAFFNKIHYEKEIKNYPVVFKTVIGNSAKGVYFPKTKDELLLLIEEHYDEIISLLKSGVII